MSRHSDTVRMQHMLDHAREAACLARGKAREELDSDRVLCLALVRLLEIVGEAASRIPAETRDKHAGIPWPEIVGLRNRLIHGYDSVDLDILWQIVTADVPALVAELEKIIPPRTEA